MSSSASLAPGSRARPSSRAGRPPSPGSSGARTRTRPTVASPDPAVPGRRRSSPGSRTTATAGRHPAGRPARPRAPARPVRRRARPSDADLVDLDAVVGRVVRVGGLVVELTADGFTLDDGTAIGRVVLRGAAREVLALVEPDDAVNAIGRVEASTTGPSSSSTTRRGDPGRRSGRRDPSASARSVASAVALPDPRPPVDRRAGGRLAGLGNGPWRLDAGRGRARDAPGDLRRLGRRDGRSGGAARRRSAARIAGRLATFAGPSAAPAGDAGSG